MVNPKAGPGFGKCQTFGRVEAGVGNLGSRDPRSRILCTAVAIGWYKKFDFVMNLRKVKAQESEFNQANLNFPSQVAKGCSNAV